MPVHLYLYHSPCNIKPLGTQKVPKLRFPWQHIPSRFPGYHGVIHGPQSSCRRFDLKVPKGDPEDSFVPQIRIWVGDTNRKCHCAASSAALGADPDSSAFLKPGLCHNEIQLCSAEAAASPRTLPKSSGPVLADLLLIPFQGLTWRGATMRALI